MPTVSLLSTLNEDVLLHMFSFLNEADTRTLALTASCVYNLLGPGHLYGCLSANISLSGDLSNIHRLLITPGAYTKVARGRHLRTLELNCYSFYFWPQPEAAFFPGILIAAPNIRTLTVFFMDHLLQTEAVVRALCDLHHLQRMTLHGIDECLPLFSNLASAATLESLTLEWELAASPRHVSTLFAVLTPLVHLHTLIIRSLNLDLEPSSVPFDLPRQTLPSIKKLHLTRCRQHSLNIVPNFPNITSLHIDLRQYDPHFAMLMSRWTSLRDISLSPWFQLSEGRTKFVSSISRMEFVGIIKVSSRTMDILPQISNASTMSMHEPAAKVRRMSPVSLHMHVKLVDEAANTPTSPFWKEISTRPSPPLRALHLWLHPVSSNKMSLDDQALLEVRPGVVQHTVWRAKQTVSDRAANRPLASAPPSIPSR